METPENTNEIPPKVSPLKPATPGGPRPITIKLKRPATGFKPGVKLPSSASPLKPAAPAEAAPAAAVAEEKAPAVVPEVKDTPAAPAPVAEAPKPAAPAPEAKAEPEFEPMKTVKLKPIAVKPVASSPSATANITPPTEAQVQAAKSKTSRISLDSAVGIAPVGSEQPKTIKIKRPIGLARPAASTAAATAAGKTSRIPDSEIPAVAQESGAPKTLKIKRPATVAPKKTPGEVAMENADTESDDTFANLTPLTELPAPKEEFSKMLGVSIGVGVVAAIVIVMLCLCLGSQAMGPDAGPNSLASINGPVLPWGK